MFNHFRLAFRTLSKAPGFTAIALLTLALGIGMSTASFSITNSFLLKNLPYPESEYLVRIFRTSPSSRPDAHSPGSFLDIREALNSCYDLTGYLYDGASYSEPGQAPQQVYGLTATANFLSALHVTPALGRGFAPDDDQPGKPRVALLTQRMWQRRFGSDPAVVGRILRLNSEDFTIIGVLPASFDAPTLWGTADFLRPLTVSPDWSSQRKDNWIHIAARLKPGSTLTTVQTQLDTIATRLAKDHPTEFGKDGMSVVGLASSNMDGINRLIIWMVTGLAVMVLLVACANLASLQLARSFSRAREFAIRSALGASRLQLMAPLLAESMVLAIGGGLLGILLASWSNSWMSSRININGEDSGFDISLDPRVIAFAVVVSLLTGLAFGLIPAWLASRTPASNALKESSRGSSGGRTHKRLRFSLVIAEITLSLILVATASSFAIAAHSFLDRELGWKPDHVTVGSIGLPFNRFNEDNRRREFTQDLLSRLQAIPGVEKAAIASAIPSFSYFNNQALIIEGLPEPVRGQETFSELAAVSSEYFSLLQIPVREGNIYVDSIKSDAPAVAVINESFARHFWPGQSPLGKRFRTVGSERWMEIVAIVGDVRMAGNLSAPLTKLQFYRPLSQNPGNFLTVALRSSQPSETLVASLRKVVASIDADIPVSQAGDLPTLIRSFMANMDLITINLSAYAFMGLLIASIGIYGVISHITAQRTRDIGIRIALGASPAHIQRQVLSDGIRILIIGLVLGVLGAYGVNHMLSLGMPEFGLPGLLPQTVSIICLAVVTLVATYIPARRAAALDPVEALRAD